MHTIDENDQFFSPGPPPPLPPPSKQINNQRFSLVQYFMPPLHQ